MVRERAVLQAPGVVIEWETVRACDAGRAEKGVLALCEQLRSLSECAQGVPEVVITFDPDTGVDASIRSLVDAAAGPRGWPGKLTIVAVPAGTDYYGHKNFGFSLTRNPVVVFLDSDLIPDPGWLRGMLEPFVDFKVSVVVGNTYMDAGSFYAKCVALFWIFETRDPRPGLARTNWLVSNSIAFRRAVFAHCPFPERLTYRGQCSELGQILARKGICLYLNSAAQAQHPPPRGIRNFVRRAIFAGHDECSYCRLAGPVSVLQAYARFMQDLRAVCSRIARRRARIRASVAVVIAAAGLGLIYYWLKLIAFLITTAWPSGVRRMFVWPEYPVGRD